MDQVKDCDRPDNSKSPFWSTVLTGSKTRNDGTETNVTQTREPDPDCEPEPENEALNQEEHNDKKAQPEQMNTHFSSIHCLYYYRRDITQQNTKVTNTDIDNCLLPIYLANNARR